MLKKGVQTTKNPKETAEVARVFINELLKNKKTGKGALVIGLSGELGAGKTTFTKTVAHHLGVKGKISSPTFVIIKKYPLKKVDRYKFLFHLDAYRLKNAKELLELGWEEIIHNRENIVFIEWPENVKQAMPGSAKFIYISHDVSGAENQRKFQLK
ncbi:MAG: tRNA (adenosine(37)-N6)-threonylcarbamoyltransferase complex ATPase subunit type 1 TsaE [Minisyncoccia bacterium]